MTLLGLIVRFAPLTKLSLGATLPGQDFNRKCGESYKNQESEVGYVRRVQTQLVHR